MAASTALSSGLQKPHTDDEETVIVLEASNISSGRDRCSKSLVGRLLADRSFSICTTELALNSIWRQPDGFKVTYLGGNKFQFFFDDENGVIRIERGAPWLFKNFILNLQQWERKTCNTPIFSMSRHCLRS
ncbi:hypothetical protein PIB30_026282 [Stylosanthes scabra]|uniref:DUF4283 domain-containing protein n=1 Tax=Stylosanthes scabra TaxID=79078 RepID=A0ABU6TA33_9FABA|nr:hypothetical protein [Stylosanthes scabra]